MGNNDRQPPLNPEYKTNIPVAYPLTSENQGTYAILDEEQNTSTNVHRRLNNRNNNDDEFTEIPLREQVILIDNRTNDDGPIVAGLVAGTVASLMCCTIL